MPRVPAWYYFLGGASALLIFAALVWGPALLFIASVATEAGAGEPLAALVSALRLAFFDQSTALLWYYVTLALLAGANIALLAYYWRVRHGLGGVAPVSGAAGALAAMLGFGCASCGTLFLSILAASLGGLSLASLPLYDELSLVLRGVGLALLAFSLWRLLRHVGDPLVCPA
jgi:hypothetical protein